MEDDKGLERVEENSRAQGVMAVCAHLRRRARPLLRWSSGTLGRPSQGRVSGKGDQGVRGGLGRLPGEGVLTWALQGGLRMRAGGMNDVMVLPKGCLPQAPFSARPVTTHQHDSHYTPSY